MKLFLKDKKITAAFACVGVITFFLTSSAVLILHYYLYAAIEECENTYGTYAFRVESTDSEVLEQIQNESFVKRSLLSYWSVYDNGRAMFTTIEADEAFIEMSGYRISEGSYPAAEDEVAVTKYYLLQLGIASEDMIGSYISLPFEDKDTKYKVTGIAEENRIFENDGYHYTTFLFCPHGRTNSLLIEIKDLSKAPDVNEKLLEKYPQLNEKVYINAGLIFSIHVDENVTVYDQFDRLRQTAVLLLTVCSAVILLNFMKLYLHRNRKNLAALRIMGVDRRLIAGTFLAAEFLVFILGSGIGLTISTVGVYRLFYGFANVRERFLSEYPLGTVLLVLFVNLLVISIVFAAFSFRMARMTANTAGKEEGNRHAFGHGKHLFGEKSRCYRIRFSLKDIRSRWIETLISVIGICGAGTILIILLYYARELNISTVSNNTMNVRLQGMRDDGSAFPEKIDDKRILKLLEQFSPQVERIGSYEMYGTTVLSASQMTEAMKEYVLKNSGDMAFFRMSGKIDAGVEILGYSREMLEQLIKEQNLAFPEEGQAIIYSKTMISPVFQTEHKLTVGDCLDITFYGSEYEDISLEICGVSKELPLFADSDTADLLLVVSTEEFMKMFRYFEPQVYYLKYNGTLSESDEAILRELYQFPTLFVSEPLQEAKELAEYGKAVEKLTLVLYAVFILLSLTLIAGSLYVNAYLREKEYCTLMAIGETAGGIFRIIIFRLLLMWFVSMALGFLISYPVTRVLFQEEFGNELLMFYQYPWTAFMWSQAAVLFSFAVISVPIYFNYKKKHSMEVLKCE